MEDQSMRKRREESDCHCRSLRMGSSEAGREWAEGMVRFMLLEVGEVARGSEPRVLWDKESTGVGEGAGYDAVSGEGSGEDGGTAEMELKGFLEEGFH